MTYSEKLKDPRWQKKRLEVLNRDNFTCRDCGSDKKTLHVHHCAYSGPDPWMASESSLLTLCADCHESRQSLEDDAHTMLGQIMAKMTHKTGAENELDGFVKSLVRELTNPDFCPTVVNAYDLDYLEAHQAA